MSTTSSDSPLPIFSAIDSGVITRSLIILSVQAKDILKYGISQSFFFPKLGHLFLFFLLCIYVKICCPKKAILHSIRKVV